MNRYKVTLVAQFSGEQHHFIVKAYKRAEAVEKARALAKLMPGYENTEFQWSGCVLQSDESVGMPTDELLKDIHTAILAGVVLAALIGLGIIALLALLTMRHLGAY